MKPTRGDVAAIMHFLTPVVQYPDHEKYWYDLYALTKNITKNSTDIYDTNIVRPEAACMELLVRTLLTINDPSETINNILTIQKIAKTVYCNLTDSNSLE